MSKSHVSMEQKMCYVTGKPFDSGALLLDKKLRNSLERNTVTGWGISPEVQEKIDEGYVALVAIDPSKSEVLSNGNVSPNGAYRTGAVAYVKKDVLKKIVPTLEIEAWGFCSEEFIDHLQRLQAKPDEDESTDS